MYPNILFLILNQIYLICNELLKTSNAKIVFLFYSLQLMFKNLMVIGWGRGGEKERKTAFNGAKTLKQMFAAKLINVDNN